MGCFPLSLCQENQRGIQPVRSEAEKTRHLKDVHSSVLMYIRYVHRDNVLDSDRVNANE